jgi:hypothetical protein
MARKRPAINPASDDKAIDQAVERMRRWYRLGARSLKRRPADASSHAGAVEEDALRLGVSVAKLRKLRQFADPVNGYDEKRLEQLISLCEAKRHVPEITALLRLVSVPVGGHRDRLQRMLVAGRWGVRRLEVEIAARLGRRRQGGRKPRVSDDVAGVMVQLDALVERWLRWQHELSGRPAYEQLRPKLRSLIEKVNLAVEELRKTAAIGTSHVEVGGKPGDKQERSRRT